MPQYKKDSPIFNILEMLGHVSLATVDILDMMLSGYSGSGMSKENYKNMKRRIEGRHSDFNNALEERKKKQRFYSLISKMQKEGLIKKDVRQKKSFWKITEKGEEKHVQWLRKIDYPTINALPPDLPRHYETQKSKQNIIVIFDIPEKERNKREWFRSVLYNLDFEKLQESVFIGRNRIPKELLNDLRGLRIINCIHIFAISRKGTIGDSSQY